MTSPQGKIQHNFIEQGRVTLEGISFENADGTLGVDSELTEERINAEYDKNGKDKDGSSVSFSYMGQVNERQQEFILDAHTFVRMGRPRELNVYRNTIIAPVTDNGPERQS